MDFQDMIFDGIQHFLHIFTEPMCKNIFIRNPPTAYSK